MDKAQAITLVEYNTWAKHRVLIKAPHLTSDERLRETTLSHQTTLGTLIHILDTQWYWREGAQTGKLATERLSSDNFQKLAELRRRWEEEDRLLLNNVHGLPAEALNGSATYHWLRAQPRTRPLWHILQHIINHGMHHRTKSANIWEPWGIHPRTWTLSSLSRALRGRKRMRLTQRAIDGWNCSARSNLYSASSNPRSAAWHRNLPA